LPTATKERFCNNELRSIGRTDRDDSILRLDPGARCPYLPINRPIRPFLQSAWRLQGLRRRTTNMQIHSAFPLTLLQRLDRWLWELEQKGRERYIARAADRFELERRIRDIDRAGAFWFG
jgi:hypothetical protein